MTNQNDSVETRTLT